MSMAGKTVLVTGAAGTVGRELIRQLADVGAAEIRALDCNESEVFFLGEEFGDPYRRHVERDYRFHGWVGDVRDPDRILYAMEGVDVVFHAAALKHVVLCEQSPSDAVHTNILGTTNVVKAAIAHDVEKVIFTSSDKAVNPTSVMGTSKLMGERLITAANNMKGTRRTIFTSTRFGNVIGSRGSVVPTFASQIRAGGPVTLTDSRMTRFVMTISEAVRLVLSATDLARGGEVFITKMPVIRIIDLAAVMIEALAPRFGHDPAGIEVRTIGVKPGEKLYEELMSEEERSRALELDELFAVLPAFRDVYADVDYDYPGARDANPAGRYVSENIDPMTAGQVEDYLRRHRILEGLTDQWP